MNEKTENKCYDVFVSYNSGCMPWVEILVHNLKACGFKVFFDQWDIIKGRPLHDSIYQGIRQSAKGIVVVTPDVVESP